MPCIVYVVVVYKIRRIRFHVSEINRMEVIINQYITKTTYFIHNHNKGKYIKSLDTYKVAPNELFGLKKYE